jgi:hypothetical protein
MGPIMKQFCVAFLLSVVLLLAPLCGRAGAQEATVRPPEGQALTAAAATVRVDQKSGNVVSLRLREAEEMAKAHPAGGETPFGYLEVIDLHDHRTYNPLVVRSTVVDWKVTGSGDATEITFVQEYDGAPFRIVQTFRATPVGVRWEAALRLRDGEKANRSVQVNWVLPLPTTWQFWGPNRTEASSTNGVMPYRYVYGHSDPGPTEIVIPLVGVWGKGAGAAVFSPPDVRKCQISFDVYTQNCIDASTGVFRRVEDLQSLHVAHHMVGLRPGKDLTLAVCIAGTRPDWRGVLGHYVTSYPEYFEPMPQVRKYEGMYAITTPNAWQGKNTRPVRPGGAASQPATDRQGRPGAQSRPGSQTQAGAQTRPYRPQRRREDFVAAGTTCVEVHSHFLEYGYYINDEVVANRDLEFRCRPHSDGPMTYAGNRQVVDDMLANGIAPFLYFYNVHSQADTIEKRYPTDLMLDEHGKPEIQFNGEPAVHAQPESPFGRNLIDQLHRLIKAYPQVPGFFVDNYAIQKIDFAHDDGVTMVHDRPGYDLNRNHQDVGTLCHQIAHKAGKVMMVNKLATVESAKGADMVLVEGCDFETFAATAMACCNRSLFPLNWEYPDRALANERCLQCMLIWGGTPSTIVARDPALLKAYRPLTDAMIGKRWVFDEDPLTLPAGYDGQVFRVDPHAPHAGDVVVSVVDVKRSWKDAKFTEGLTVTVRLPEAGELQKVTWLSAETSAEGPQPVEVTRDGNTITAKLPAVGVAGILRFSR